MKREDVDGGGKLDLVCRVKMRLSSPKIWRGV